MNAAHNPYEADHGPTLRPDTPPHGVAAALAIEAARQGRN